jgi:hypothetical protein
MTYEVAPAETKPRGSSVEWVVQRDGASRASSRHDKKAEAVERAKELARNQNSEEVFILYSDGYVARTWENPDYQPKSTSGRVKIGEKETSELGMGRLIRQLGEGDRIVLNGGSYGPMTVRDVDRGGRRSTYEVRVEAADGSQTYYLIAKNESVSAMRAPGRRAADDIDLKSIEVVN